jgi:hypothetical protein
VVSVLRKQMSRALAYDSISCGFQGCICCLFLVLTMMTIVEWLLEWWTAVEVTKSVLGIWMEKEESVVQLE